MRISAPFPRTRDRSGVKLPGLRQRWLLLPLILLIIAAAVFWWLPSRLAPAAVTTTATVSQGNLTVAVTGSGSVAAARTVDLPFQQSGTITAVLVKVGDVVKTGQTLAQIDDSDLKLQLQQAQANLTAAQAKLDQANGGTATPQDLASAQAQLASAQAQLSQTRTGTTTKADLQSAQAQLAAAQAKLDALQHPTPANMSNAQTQLAQAQTDLQTTRDSLSQAKTNAQSQLQQAVNSLTQAQSRYATAKHNWDYAQSTGNDPVQPSKTNAAGKSVPNTLSDAQRQQYYDTFVQAEAALNSAEQSVQQAQVSYDTARQKEAVGVPLAEQQFANAQAQFDALQHPSASDVIQAQAAVTQAQANISKLRQGGTPAAIAQGQASVTQAQANLEKLTAPDTAPNIASATASLIQAQVSVATAQHNLAQATLTAPFDGVVAAVSAVPSSSASTGTAAITLVDRAKLHIEVNLSETDAAKVAVGQPVALTFDALPNVTLSGQIVTIAPAATVAQNVVTYPVQIEFDPGTTPVKVGMSATADIQIQQITNAILVPSRAVQTAGNSHTVTVLQGAQKIPVPIQVETGVTSNGQTEITSCVDTGTQCLQPGDVLAVSGSTTGTTTTQGGNRGGFGGGFGGGGGGVRVPFGGG
jgi:HlyD family secretion protein